MSLLFKMNKFSVKHNTDLAISWLADEEGNTYETSQNCADLYRKCAQINECIFNELKIHATIA